MPSVLAGPNSAHERGLTAEESYVQAFQDAVLFSSHGGRMDPSKLFRNGGVVACVVGGSASDSDASQPATVKLRPKLDGTSSLKPKVWPGNPAVSMLRQSS